MNRNVVVFEGPTLEEARKKLFTESPRGVFLQSETAVDSKSKTVRAAGDSTEVAFAAALKQQPQGMVVRNKKEISSAQKTTIRVEAPDKETAAAMIAKRAGSNAILDKLNETQPPRAGFLGLGKAPGKYDGAVFNKAVVEVQFGQNARIEATFGARIVNWAGLLHHLFSPGVKIIDELAERLGHQIIFILMEKEYNSTYFEGVPFSRVTPKMVEKSRSLVHGTTIPGPLGFMMSAMGGSLLQDRYNVRPDGQTERKTNAGADSAIVSVSSCLPKGNVSLVGDALGRKAFEAIVHYAKIPIARYFLSLSFSQESLDEGPFTLEKQFDWRKYLAQIYSGGEMLLLEIYDSLPDGGVITDDLVARTVRGFFD